MKKLIPVLCLLLILTALPLRAQAGNVTTPNLPAETICQLPLAQAENVRVGALTGPTAMGMVQLLESDGCTPMIFGAADELTPLILKGEVDIAAVPANLAAVLYNRTKGEIAVLAVNVLGVLYLCEYNSRELTDVASLKGKTIYATGKGSTPEYFLRHILVQNGLDPDADVTIEWKSEPGEVVALLNANQSGIAMLPQPYVTAAAGQLGEGFRAVLSVSEEWEKAEDGTRCTTAVVIARREFIRQDPDAVESFLDQLAQSVNWVNENPEEAGALCQELGIAKAAVAQKAIPACNLVCITGSEMKQALSGCLAVIEAQNPKAVGGSLPGDDFYYGAQ